MPYFKNDKINVLFIHIPKTGGTSLENYFSLNFNIELNNNSLFYLKKDTKYNDILINSSLQHITYKQIIKYNNVFKVDFNNIKIITIVRNPYERIISDLFYFNIINIDTSKDKVYNIIQDYLNSSDYDNHNIPQYLFIISDDDKIIPNIHILHTETLTNDMKKIGYEDFYVYDNKNKFDELNYYNYLNDESISLINKYYHNDFELFGYNKIND